MGGGSVGEAHPTSEFALNLSSGVSYELLFLFSIFPDTGSAKARTFFDLLVSQVRGR